MKKIFTILLAVGSITFASAQSGNDWSHSKGNSRNIVYAQPNSRDIYRGTVMGGNPFFKARENTVRFGEDNRRFGRIRQTNWNGYGQNRWRQQIRVVERPTRMQMH